MGLKRIKWGVGAIFMLAATLISDHALTVLVYLLSALLHELGHLIAARALKIEVKEIRFGFSGVRIITGERLTSYKNEIILALSGPAVNIGVCIAIFALFSRFGGGVEGIISSAERFLGSPSLDRWGIAAFLGLSSLIQAAMNLIPVKTFDGGRIFYCTLAHFCGERVAERAIEITTVLAGLGLWTVALYLMLKVGGGLGIYVFAACILMSGLKGKA